MQCVLAFSLELKEVGVASQRDASIPDPTGVFASRNPGEDWSEERIAVDVNRWGSHALAYLLHSRLVAFADRVVILGRLGGLRQLRWQAQFIKRFRNHCGHILIALVVNTAAHSCVE